MERGDDRTPLETVPREARAPARRAASSSLRSTWRPTSGASSAKNASASSSVGSSGATARSSSSVRLADGAGRGPVAHLVEVVGVRDDERAARQVEDVELDQVDTVVDGGPERADVFSGAMSAAPRCPIRRTLAVDALERDHPALRPARRHHHQASAARTTAWPTVRTAAIVETSRQSCSG